MSHDQVTLHHIRVFREVARTRSYTSAARHMNLSQSALSRSVAQLERHLGARLLSRDTRNVETTSEGREFLALADDLVRDLNDGLERFDRYAKAQTGTLAVSTLASFAAGIFPALIKDFFRENEDLDLHLADGGNDEVVGDLVRGRVELAIAATIALPDHLSVFPILEEEFYAVAPDDHPWVGRDAVSWSDFDGEQYVAARHGTSIRAIADQAITDAGAVVRHRFNVANIATLGGLVRAGFGVSALPAMEFEGYRLDDLVRLPITGTAPRRTVAVLADSDRDLSPTARRFLDLVPHQIARLPLPRGMHAIDPSSGPADIPSRGSDPTLMRNIP